MRLTHLTLLLALAVSPVAIAQQGGSFPVPNFDVSLGYQYIHANAPPNGCQCFGINGFYVDGVYNITDHIGITGKFSEGSAGDISQLEQDLTLKTYMGGIRLQRPYSRINPYVQALVGGAHGSNSYFPTGTTVASSASSFAAAGTGGIDVNLNQHFAIRAIDVGYLHTALPNGSNNEQNQLTISAGLVVKFGARDPNRMSKKAIEVAETPASLELSCSTDTPDVTPGTVIHFHCKDHVTPAKTAVDYAWNTSGGILQGTGPDVTVNTTGMAPGDYQVTGHVFSVADKATTADSAVPFHIRAVEVAPTPAEIAKQDQIFHENVADALFDYDSSDIRPDAQVAINHAAAFLKDHPEIRVQIQGYADDRGSTEYNLALGEKRADAARQALITAGIAPERLEIISFGKEAQVCTDQTESCYQLNRRAAFSMHH